MILYGANERRRFMKNDISEKNLETIQKVTEYIEKDYERSGFLLIGILLGTPALVHDNISTLLVSLGLSVSFVNYLIALCKDTYRSSIGESKEIMQSREYLELQGIYKNVLQEIRTLMKKMDAESSIEVCVVFEHLFKNGYLSKDHTFLYTNGSNNARLLEGTSVVNGTGRPIDVQSFLRDLLVEDHFESYILLLKNKEWQDALLHEYTECIQKDPTLFQKICTMLVVNYGIRSEWPVTLVKEANRSYMIDFYYNSLFLTGKNKKVYLVKDDAREKGIFGFAKASYPRKYNNMEYKKERSLLEPTEDDSLREKYLRTKERCVNHQDLFETFYREHQDLYKELACQNDIYCEKIKRL